MTITVSTDGSALGNPNGPMGWAWADHAANAARTDGHQHDGDSDAGGATNGTNQIGELCAVLEALRAHRGAEPLTIETDSQYAINCSTKWVKGWKKNGWKNSQHKPVKNAPLIKAIDAEIGRREGPVKFVWVKGHNGNPGNEKVDDLAHTYSGDARSGVKDGYLPLEGWQSLLASPYAKGVDIPTDAKMLIDGKITEEQYHLGRGAASGNDDDDDWDDSENGEHPITDRESNERGQNGHKPTLAEQPAEPEGVPEYDFSPRKPLIAHHHAEEDDKPSGKNSHHETGEDKEPHPIGRTVRSHPDSGVSPADHDAVARKNGDPTVTETELPITDEANESADSSGSQNLSDIDANQANSDLTSTDSNRVSETSASSDSDNPCNSGKADKDDSDNPQAESADSFDKANDHGQSNDSNGKVKGADPRKETKPAPAMDHTPAYLPNGLSVNGTLRFSPAPQTSPTYNGRPRHIRGVIAIDVYVAGDGTIVLDNAPFLIASNHKK